MEPHWLFPGFQWLPVAARAQAMRRWPIGHYPAGLPRSEAVEHVLNIELVSVTELESYFPEAEIWRERFLGLTKSIVAVR